jgi:predicted aldo/keto reductase-like oxidoreductase
MEVVLVDQENFDRLLRQFLNQGNAGETAAQYHHGGSGESV